MDQVKVKERALELQQRQQDAKDELERIKTEFKILEKRCEHPDIYAYYVMGDRG